jgi:hypothetical protein
MLGLAGVLSAWCGYQGSLFGGQQSAAYARASSLRTQATKASTFAGQLSEVDAFSFVTWTSAHASGNERLADLVAARMRPELKLAFDAWLALDPFENRGAPPTPFKMPQYRSRLMDESARLTAQADESERQGNEANRHSDDYGRATVLFALSLFFAGVAQQFDRRGVRVGVLVLAGAFLVFGLSVALALPRAMPG